MLRQHTSLPIKTLDDKNDEDGRFTHAMVTNFGLLTGSLLMIRLVKLGVGKSVPLFRGSQKPQLHEDNACFRYVLLLLTPFELHKHH